MELPTAEIAARLRVSPNSVNVWRRRWKAGGRDALASKGANGSACRLAEDQLLVLAAELDRGPAAHGWVEDQRWTLARIAALIVTLFRVRYTLRGVSYLLHRMGYSAQIPVHRAAQRDEAAIAAWRQDAWEQGKR